jgi:hypothetical protein
MSVSSILPGKKICRSDDVDIISNYKYDSYAGQLSVAPLLMRMKLRKYSIDAEICWFPYQNLVGKMQRQTSSLGTTGDEIQLHPVRTGM